MSGSDDEGPETPGPETLDGSSAAGSARPPPAGSFWEPLGNNVVWGLLAIRGYLALVFFQAALGHLAVPAASLARAWTPHGAFAFIGSAVSAHPAQFVDLVIALELALAVSVSLGVLTRIAGFGGLMLNAFFFAAFEWTDSSQLYLSWDASLAALWFVVLLTAPGRFVGLGYFLVRRFPRLGRWLA